MATEFVEGEEENFEEEQPKEEITSADIKLLKEIRHAISTDNATLGLKTTMQALKNKDLSKVVLTNNVPQKVRDDVLRFAQMSKAIVEDFAGSNEQLGMECKRPHSVLLIGIKKAVS